MKGSERKQAVGLQGANPAAAPSLAFVNGSLAHGLACRAESVLAAQGERYRTGMRPIVGRRFRSKKAVSHVVARLAELGKRCRLIQVIGRTPNGRQASVCQFVPGRFAPSEGWPGAVISFDFYQLLVSVHGAVPGSDWGTRLAATEHALERLFLRLNTLDLGAVLEELHDAMLLALPTTIAGRALGLRQVALPTSSGALLCELQQAGSGAVAKTWLSDCALADGRWRAVVDRVRQVVRDAGGEQALGEFLALGINGPLAEQSHALVGELGNALSRFAWLKDEYAPRPDPVGDQWARAREAASEPQDYARYPAACNSNNSA